ncbi:sugar phosphate isomerase/epimerase family protein [Enemella sp. A6]|uniref:sugar phosphate isomerase/epimerase family protein n=1 Tax=Enemella sp. A6 TaxID=3440152 RepID=UPI003EBCAB41
MDESEKVTFNVSPMPFLHLPLATELQLADDWPEHTSQGLAIDKLRDTGWAESGRLLHRAEADISYLVTGTFCPVDDDLGWQQHRQILTDAVHWAGDHSVPIIYFTPGPSGRLTPDQAVDAFARQVAPLVELAERNAVTLAVENTVWVRSDLGFTHSVRETAALAASAGLALCVDLFCAWQEQHLADTLTQHRDRIVIVQYSDYQLGTHYQPARRVPGDGDIPLPWLVDLVPQIGYTGLIDLELIGPAIEDEGPEAAVSRGLAWLAAQRWHGS